MTAYFDGMGARIDATKTQGDTTPAVDALREIERQMVYDCLLATTFPGFPEEVREQIDLAIRVHGIDQRPDLDPPADFETIIEHRAQLDRLQFDLHSAFHELARLRLPGFSDDPRVPPWAAVSAAKERQEDDAAALKLLRDLLAELLDPGIAVRYALGPPPGEGWLPNVERGTWEKWALGAAKVVIQYRTAEADWWVRCYDFAAGTMAEGCTPDLTKAVKDTEAWLAERTTKSEGASP